MSLQVDSYAQLSEKQKQTIENNSSRASRLVKSILTTFLSPAVVGLILLTPVGKILSRFSWVDLTKFSMESRIKGFVGFTGLALISLIYRVVRLSMHPENSILRSIHSLVKDKLGVNQVVRLKYSDKIFYITKDGFSENDTNSKFELISVKKLLN